MTGGGHLYCTGQHHYANSIGSDSILRPELNRIKEVKHWERERRQA